MSEPIDLVLGKLDRTRKTARGWCAKCPAHDDRGPSLSVAIGDGGKVILHCFAGCRPDDVVAAIGLRMEDLFPPREWSWKERLNYHQKHEAKSLAEDKATYHELRHDPDEWINLCRTVDLCRRHAADIEALRAIHAEEIRMFKAEIGL